MSLCFTEIIIFSILSLISVFIGDKIFVIIFLLSIIATIIIKIKIEKEIM